MPSLVKLAPVWLRRAVAQVVDPWVARRARILIRRHTRGTTRAGDALGQAIDALRDRALFDAATDVLANRLPVDQNELNRVVAAHLERLEPNAVPDQLTGPVSHAFTALWQPDAEPVRPPAQVVERAISDQFHRLYYHVSARTWKNTTYQGTRTYKCPTDMWIYTELIHRLRPSLIIETGTYRGGSALFLAHCLDRIGHGEVVTIDIQAEVALPEHPRVTYLSGSSTAPEIIDEVKRRLPDEGHVLVILDSDHRQEHVAAEIAAYAPMVTPDSYLIVEDTNVNGHPAWPSWGPGPYEAAQDFLAEDPGFVVDTACERYYLTQNPNGYLRRVH